MPQVHTVKAARKDYPDAGIKKGETYYYWEFRYGGLRRSKTPPKPSQLTQSAFLSGLYSAQEAIEAMDPESYDTVADFMSDLESIKGDLESLGDDCQNSLDNMPEGLQQGDTGQLLQDRIDGIQTLTSDFDSLEDSEPDDVDKDDLADELGKKEKDLTEEEIKTKYLEMVHEKIQELKDEVLGGSWDIS